MDRLIDYTKEQTILQKNEVQRKGQVWRKLETARGDRRLAGRRQSLSEKARRHGQLRVWASEGTFYLPSPYPGPPHSTAAPRAII